MIYNEYALGICFFSVQNFGKSRGYLSVGMNSRLTWELVLWVASLVVTLKFSIPSLNFISNLLALNILVFSEVPSTPPKCAHHAFQFGWIGLLLYGAILGPPLLKSLTQQGR
jgi:hypothetical protein